MTITTKTLFSVTIFGYRKPGMPEDEYHRYVSETHAGHLKGLLAENKIVSYHMQHNSPSTRALIGPIFGKLPEDKISDCDCVVQIVFRDVEDYVKVKNDEQYKAVVVPDHDNFADGERTKFATGWFEFHVRDGLLV